ncbi:TPA: hypothetical protein R4302_005362 [Klebsiella oxytoca]|uniref:hypothetical protein n=1 Tax=Klebsiella oxytoca TaxID=571 RepID=UPI001D0E42B1|nr:hypothetical protein [Klebsiella oxytoca]HED4271361.1 hypothetical protein [Klebsiella oxytoca]
MTALHQISSTACFLKKISRQTLCLISSPAGNREVNVRMLVELSALTVQGAEDADLNVLFAGSP